MIIQTYKSQRTPNRLNYEEVIIKKHYNQTVKSKWQRENFESRERKETPCKATFHKTISRFLIRNFVGQEIVGCFFFKVLKQTNKRYKNQKYYTRESCSSVMKVR